MQNPADPHIGFFAVGTRSEHNKNLLGNHEPSLSLFLYEKTGLKTSYFKQYMGS